MTQRFTLQALVRRPLAALTPARDEALAALLACALAAGFAAPSAFAAETAPAATGASAGAPAASSPTQITVKPGQSLNDIAIAVTQSHDKTVLGRAARAIFDANPAAFMRGDPSLMKLGAVLNVPPLDATGAVVKAPAQPAAAASAPSAPSAAASGASKPAASAAPAPVSAPAQTANVKPAPAAPAAASASTAPQAPAAAHAQPSPAPAAQPGAASQTGSAGGHAWTGAIQPAPAPAASQPSSVTGGSVVAASGAAGASSAGASAAEGAVGTAASGANAASAAAPASVGSSPSPAQAAVPARSIGSSSAAAGAGAGSGAPAASAASASTAHVSSLQQLLTLKNRVLKEWQQHGFGSSAQRQAQGSANGGTVAGVQGSATAGAGTQQGTAPDRQFVGIGGLGLTLSRATIAIAGAIGAAIVAVLVVLLGALLLGGRKRRAVAAAAAAAADIDAMPTKGEASAQASLTGLPPAGSAQDPREAEFLTALARTPTSKRALMGLAGHYAERRNVTGFDEIAQRIWHLTGGRGPNWEHVAVLGRQLDPDNPLYGGVADQAGDALAATAAAQVESAPAVVPEQPHAPAAALPGAHASAPDDLAAAPSAPSAKIDEVRAPAAQAEAQKHEPAPAESAGVGDEPARVHGGAVEHLPAPEQESELAREPQAAAQAESEPESESLPTGTHEAAASEPAPVESVEPQHASEVEPTVEPHALTEEAATAGTDAGESPAGEPVAPEVAAEHASEAPAAEHAPEAAAAHEAELAAEHEPESAQAHAPAAPEQQLPADAVAALADLDMGLPPRAEPTHDASDSKTGAAEPVQAPTHEQLHDEPDEDEAAAARPVGETIVHGVAGPAAVAGLGAAPFGALNLSFDLDLPAGAGEPAQVAPVPTFTPEQLTKIARNKLDLASEYISLGDLGGARTLLHEVIESNDAGTRDEAHALLASLASHS